MTVEKASPYRFDYPGYFAMTMHDANDELRRWFDNYKTDRNAWFLERYEWLAIEDVAYVAKRRRCVRYVGVIGAEHTDKRRTVAFESNAPPPPTFMRPAREKYRPEPTQSELAARRRSSMYDDFTERMARELVSALAISPLYLVPPSVVRMLSEAMAPPPPPRYRRN